MVQKLRKSGSRFRRNERGAVLLLFILVFMPMMLLIAIAIDYSQFLVMKRQLAAAVDAAALDLAQSPGLDEDEAEARARAFIEANYPAAAIGKLGTVTVTPMTNDDPMATVTATASMPTTFMKMGGVEKLDVTLSGSAIRTENKVELVMVLDNSGSMGGTKLAALKDAATTLVNILYSAPDAEKYVRVGLVPFNASVNVGAKNYGASWLDTGGLSKMHSENIDLREGETLFTLFDEITNVSWGGCVRARPAPYDTDDAAPVTSDPETLFVPYFAPDEPGSAGRPEQGYTNSYLNDVPPASMLSVAITDSAPDDCTAAAKKAYASADERNTAIQRCRSKYKNVAATGKSPNDNCVGQSILPLTNDTTAIYAAINGMIARGSTVIPQGIMWGWHVVSPGEPFTEGTPYDERVPGKSEITKAIVVMTDGQNAVQGGGNGHNKSNYSSYGYAGEGGHLDTGRPEQTLNEKTALVCENVKKDKDRNPNTTDILIFTIAFSVSDPTTRNLLRDCASDPGKAFASESSDELRAVFQKIAVGLNQLRLAK